MVKLFGCAPASPIAYYQQVGRAGRSSARYYRNTFTL